MILVMIGFMSCGPVNHSSDNTPIIGKPDITLTGDRMTPEVLWAFGRVSGPEISPDGKTVIYGVSYYSVEQNKGNRELYSVDINGDNYRQLTHSPKSEFNAIWRPDGNRIGFLSSESGSVQMWEMLPDGSDVFRLQISMPESPDSNTPPIKPRSSIRKKFIWTISSQSSMKGCQKHPDASWMISYTGIGIPG